MGVGGVSRYTIVFFSNQLTPKRHTNNAKTVEAYQTEWKKKIGLIARAVCILTHSLLIIDLSIDLTVSSCMTRRSASSQQPNVMCTESRCPGCGPKLRAYSNPLPSTLVRPPLLSQVGSHPHFTPLSRLCHPLAGSADKSSSFYVGDSAGRKGDFSAAASDRKFALNVGVDFHTPEVSSPSQLSLERRILIQVSGYRNISSKNPPRTMRSQGFIHLPFLLAVRTASHPSVNIVVYVSLT